MRKITMFDHIFDDKGEEIYYDIEVYKNYFCCGFLFNDFFEFHYVL